MQRRVIWVALMVLPVVVRNATAQGNVQVVRDHVVDVGTASIPGSSALDGAGALLWDLDGDGQQELLGFSADRLVVMRSNGSVLYSQDGVGAELWKERKPLLVRVGTNKYVVVKSAPCGPLFCAMAQLEVVALFSDANYQVGQQIATAPFASGAPEGQVFSVLMAGLPAVEPGSSGTVVAVSRNICNVRTYDLSVSASGVIAFTPRHSLPCPPAGPVKANGASLYEVRDINGINPEWFLFATDVIRVSDLSQVASWIDLNAMVVPNVQGGSFTLNFAHSVGNHVDSTVLINSGTLAAPQYRLFALADNGEMFAADLTKSPAGLVTLVPRFGTASGNHQIGTGPGAESLAVGKLWGAPSRSLANGRYVFDRDGNILADMNAQVTVPSARAYLANPFLWYATAAGARVLDASYGFEIQGSVLAQVMPLVAPPARPYAGAIFYQLWRIQPGLSWSHPPSFKQGFPHVAKAVIDIDAAGNVRERLLCVRTQKACTVLRAADEQILLAGPTSQGQRDRLLAHTQQSHVMRGWDSIWLERVLGYSN